MNDRHRFHVGHASCPDYASPRLDDALNRCLAPLGGLESMISPGDRVFCKLNLLMPAAPDRAITTHPAVVRAIVRMIRNVGGTPVLGDNPAVLGRVDWMDSAHRFVRYRCGLRDVLAGEDVEWADMAPTRAIHNPQGRCYQHFVVSRAVVDADHLINLPKLKTHGLVGMTLAIKNLLGVIPGLRKSEWHARTRTAQGFAGFLLDLHGAICREFEGDRRILHVLDGVTALEGEGPGSGGTPRQTGILLASTSAPALDHVACTLVGVRPRKIPTILGNRSRRYLLTGDRDPAYRGA